MKVDKDFEIQLNKLLCDLNIAKYTFLHSHLHVKGMGSISLKNKYESIYNWINDIILALSRRMIVIDMTPYSSPQEIIKHTSLKSFKPNAFRTVPACIDTLIHLTEIVADVHALSTENEDDVTSSFLIEINSYLENEIWLLKSEYAKPPTAENIKKEK